MTPADKPKFAATLIGLSQVKPGGKLTPEALEIYWLGLQDWSLPQFMEACSHLSKSCEFMPNPYHFAQLRKAGDETPGEAWTRVLARVRSMWPNEQVSVDPRTDRVVRAMGGYRALCETDSEFMSVRAKRFAELWEELGSAEDARDSLPLLTAGRDQPKLQGPVRLGSIGIASTFGDGE